MSILDWHCFRSEYKWINQVQFALPSLLLLVLLNVTLFLKLSKIEYAAQSFYRLNLQEENSLNLASDMVSRAENIQKSKDQAHRLKGVLQDSIMMLEQLKNSLIMLQRTFDLLNKNKTNMAVES